MLWMVLGFIETSKSLVADKVVGLELGHQHLWCSLSPLMKQPTWYDGCNPPTQLRNFLNWFWYSLWTLLFEFDHILKKIVNLCWSILGIQTVLSSDQINKFSSFLASWYHSCTSSSRWYALMRPREFTVPQNFGIQRIVPPTWHNILEFKELFHLPKWPSTMFERNFFLF